MVTVWLAIAGTDVCREEVRTRSLGESKSRNKVSVGEPAEGSLSCFDIMLFVLNQAHGVLFFSLKIATLCLSDTIGRVRGLVERMKRLALELCAPICRGTYSLQRDPTVTAWSPYRVRSGSQFKELSLRTAALFAITCGYLSQRHCASGGNSLPREV